MAVGVSCSYAEADMAEQTRGQLTALSSVYTMLPSLQVPTAMDTLASWVRATVARAFDTHSDRLDPLGKIQAYSRQYNPARRCKLPVLL